MTVRQMPANKKKEPGRQLVTSGLPKDGGYLLFQLVGQYHRRWRAYLLCSEWIEVDPRRNGRRV